MVQTVSLFLNQTKNGVVAVRKKKKMGVANITFDLYKLNPKDFIGCLNIKATFYEIYSISYDIKCMGAKSVLRWVCFHYWASVRANVKICVCHWFCGGVVLFIKSGFLLFLTYWSIYCIYWKGVHRVSLFCWENFLMFPWLVCLKNAGGWGKKLFEEETSRGWNERNLRSHVRGLKSCSDIAAPVCQIHH